MYYAPGLNRFYKALPILGASPWPMRWLVLYVPVVPIATSLMLRYSFASDPRAAMGVSATILVVALALDVSEPRDYYRRQSYDPTVIRSAWTRFSAGEAAHHSIRSVGVVVGVADRARLPLNRNDMFVNSVSPLVCYNPAFGYRLEHFSTDGISEGPVLKAEEGHFNFKNPVCYLYPAQSGCRPGDPFQMHERRALSALVDYRPMPFTASVQQSVANYINLIAVAGVAVFLLVWGLLWVHAGAGEFLRRR
jgi:hypothetical protein